MTRKLNYHRRPLLANIRFLRFVRKAASGTARHGTQGGGQSISAVQDGA
jgi:hypothetical protein